MPCVSSVFLNIAEDHFSGGGSVRIPYWETFWSNDKLTHQKPSLPFSDKHIDSQRKMILCIRTSQRHRVPFGQVYDEVFDEFYRIASALRGGELKYLCDAERDWMSDAVCPVVTCSGLRIIDHHIGGAYGWGRNSTLARP